MLSVKAKMHPQSINKKHSQKGSRMSVTIIFKIAAVGILVTVLSQVLKHSGRDEQAFLLSLAGLIIVLFWIVPYISELFETMESLFSI
jgi:stage III sporulation protein AC